MVERWSRWVMRRAGTIVAGVCLITALAVTQLVDLSSGELTLRIDPAVDELLPVEDAERRYLAHVERVFGRTDSVMVAVYFGEVFQSDNLATLERLDKRLRGLDGVAQVQSLASAPYLAGEEDTLEMGAISDQAGSVSDLAETVRANPLYSNTLLSEDGDATALIVSLRPDYEQNPGAEALVESIRRTAEQTVKTAQVRLAGPPVVKAATGKALVREFSRILPTIFVLVAVLLAISFRNLPAVLLPLITIAVSLVWIMGLIALAGRSLNLITAIVPPVVITIGMAYALHLLSAVYRETNEPDAVARGLADIALPLLMTGATTAAGFLALGLSPLPPIREFAWLSALGVLISVALSLSFLPALLHLTGCRDMPPPPGLALFRRFAGALAGFDVRFRRGVLGAGALVTVLAVVGMLGIQVGTDYVGGFPKKAPVRADFDRIGADFGGATPLSVVLESPVPDSFAQPENLQKLATLQNWLKEQPEVGSVTSLVDYLKVLNRSLHAGDNAHFAIPESASAVKQILLFGGGDTLESLVDSNFKRTLIQARVKLSGSRQIGELVARIEERMAQLPEPIDGRVTGSPVLISKAVDSIAGGQLVTIGAALLVVFLLLSALFTSMQVGALALLPNLIPVLVYFGTLGWFDIPLNPTTSLIACIVLGIAVDDTLYYFARFNADARRMASELKATASALRTVIRPVTYTSAALVLGFLVLTVSDLQNQVQFGALAAFTIAVAWLTDITFTPALASGVRIVTLWDVLRLDLGERPQQSIPLFADLSLRQARVFALLSKIQRFAAGERVMSDGDEAGDIFVVIDGELRAWVRREDEEVELSRMGRGAVMGEVGHFAKRRTANVDALTDVRLLRFDSDDLERLRRRSPRIAALVLRNLNRIQAQRLAQTTQMLR